jgi:hypothetical protein
MYSGGDKKPPGISVKQWWTFAGKSSCSSLPYQPSRALLNKRQLFVCLSLKDGSHITTVLPVVDQFLSFFKTGNVSSSVRYQ